MSVKMIGGYPEKMRASIDKVEATRGARLDQTFQAMTLDERKDILDNYHPDYKKDGKRNIGLGPNEGDPAPNEFVDVLESSSILDPSQIDLSKVDRTAKVLIVGAGGAGTVAALWAVYSGVKPEDILMVSKLRHGDSNSMMAQGGIQAAVKPTDSPSIHYLDVVGGGHFENKPDLVEALVKDAPGIIKWHESLGVLYDKVEHDVMQTIHGGGTSRKRMHSSKDYTGMEIIRVLRDEARNVGVPVLEFTSAVEVIKDGVGNAAGALCMNMETDQYEVITAPSTIITTGGFGRLHIQNFPTTNHYGATADGLVMAYRAGAKLKDMDSVQYHPTGAAFPEEIVGLLVTEKVRGLGAQPVNRDGDQFVFPLEPRDVESAAFIRECYERDLGIESLTGMKGVWLDSPLIDQIHGKGTVKKELSAMWRMFHRFGVDMAVDPIMVFPTLHYQNGGVEIDADGWTGVKGLFAGGEVTGGVHGKNRLMGNSLLDYNVFGRRAGIAAAKHSSKTKVGKGLTLDHVAAYNSLLSEKKLGDDRKSPILVPEYRNKGVLSRSIDYL